jgi:DnaJ domain
MAVFPFPAASNVYAVSEGAGDGADCERCGTSKAVHRWACGCCGKELAWGDQLPPLHGYKDHPIGARHSSAAFLLCPHEVARRAREGVWDRSTYTGDPADWGHHREEEEDEEAPDGLPRNVLLAWQLLGDPKQKTKEAARRKYRALAKRYHPDVCKEKDAEERLKIANEAWRVLRDFYRW